MRRGLLHGVRVGVRVPDVFDSSTGRWREHQEPWEVHDPPWWRLDLRARWFWLARVRRRATGEVTFQTAGGSRTTVRVMEVDPPPRIPVEKRVRARLGF